MALAVLAAAIIAGCGSDDDNSSSSSTAASGSSSNTSTSSSAKEIKVGLTIIGPKNDRAFAQEHYDGVRSAEKDVPGVKLTSTLENRATPEQQADAVKTLATSGNKVVVTGSATFAPVIDQLADRYPDVYFITTSAFPAHFHKNVTAIVHDQGQASYVAGAIQAKLSKKNVLGYIGSLEIPSDTAAQAAWTAGAKKEKPGIKVLADRTGDFNDSAKAKEIAAAEIQQGADQLYGFVDSGIVGVFQAAKAGGSPAITDITYHGCDDPGYSNVLGVTQSDFNRIIHDALKAYQAGQLKPGAVLLGIEHPEYMDFVMCPKYKSDPELSKIRDQMSQDIIDGKIELPKAGLMPTPSYSLRRNM
jgi:basic membrane protein A